MFCIEVLGEKSKITSPYNPDFISKVKALGGKWSPFDKTWVVSSEILEDVRYAMMSIYGRDDRVPSETVDVLITFNEDVSTHCGPVVMFGQVVAYAFGRDSGARVGDNASFIEGHPESGGSMKNWYTVVPAGCVVKMIKVPKVLYDGFNPETCPSGVSVELLDSKLDKEALLQEKESLIKRLNEIEILLRMGEIA